MMKRFSLLLVIALVIGVGSAGAYTSDVSGFYIFNDASSDAEALEDKSTSGNDLTNFGATRNSTGFVFDGTNDYLNLADNSAFDLLTDDMVVCSWVKFGSISNNANRFIQKGTSGDGGWTYGMNVNNDVDYFAGTATQIQKRVANGDEYTDTTNINLWCAVIDRSSSANTLLYLDGTAYASYQLDAMVATSFDTSEPLRIGYGEGNYWNGLVSATYVWKGAGIADDFGSSNMTYIYNQGIDWNPFSSTPTNTTYFSITAVNSYNSTALTNFSAALDNGTVYTTTNGTINTPIHQNSTSLFNITVSSDENGGYFNRTYTDYNVSSNLEAGLHQAVISFSATNKVSGRNLTYIIPDTTSNDGSWTDLSNIQDDNYATSATASTASNFYANYTGLDGSETWMWGYVEETPETITGWDSTCLINNTLRMRVAREVAEIGGGVRVFCWDGSIWDSQAFAAGFGNIYESSLYNTTEAFTVTAANGDSNTGVIPQLNVSTQEITYTFNKTGYYEATTTTTLSALETGTASFEIYDHLANFTINSFGSATDQNFTLSIYSDEYDFSETVSTTEGYLEVGLIDGEYTVYVNDSIHALTQYNLTLNSSTNYTAVTIDVYTTNTVNITFIDEQTNELINETVTAYITGSIESYTYNTTNATIYAELLEPDNYIITYSAPSYEQRQYAFELTNRTYNELTLYLLNSTEDDLILFKVQDTILDPLVSYVVRSQRKNLSGTNYYTVETCTTDNEGECVQRLILYDVTYRFLVENSAGTTVFTSGDQQITSTTVTFNIPITNDVLDTTNNIYSITGDVNYNTVTEQFSYTWNDPSGIDIEACLEIKRSKRGVTTTISTQCSTAASGTITYTQSINNSYTYTATGTVNVEDETYVIDTLSIVGEQEISSVLGLQGLFIFGFLVIGIAAFLGLFNPVIPPITIIALLFILNLLGFLSIGTAAITSIAVAGIMVVYLSRS